MGTPSTRPSSMDANGDGVAVVNGRRVAVPFTIPGERVRVRLPARVAERPRRRVPSWSRCVRPSPHRVGAPCRALRAAAPRAPYPCGGCTWQHIAYPEQLRLKTGTVAQVVHAAVPGAPPPGRCCRRRPTIRGDSGTRCTSCSATAAARDGRLMMGHLARGSRQLVPVSSAPCTPRRATPMAFACGTPAAVAGVRAWEPDKRTPVGPARRGRARGPTPATKRWRPCRRARPRPRLERCATRLVACAGDRPTGLHLNLHDRDDGLIFGAETRRLSGVERVRETVAGVSFLISPTAFFQTNVAAAELLVRLVLEAVPPDLPVLDLYAGAGLFALPLAQRGAAGDGGRREPRGRRRRAGQPAAEPHPRRPLPVDIGPGRGRRAKAARFRGRGP